MYVPSNSFPEALLPTHRICAINTDIAIAWIGQLIFDIFVFLLTLLQTLRIRAKGRRSIADVFLRDGVSVPDCISSETHTRGLLGCLYFAYVEDSLMAG